MLEKVEKVVFALAYALVVLKLKKLEILPNSSYPICAYL